MLAGQADLGLVLDADGERLEPRGRDGSAALRGADPAARGRSRPRAPDGPGRHQRLDHRARREDGGPPRGEGGAHARSARPTSPRRSSSTAPSSAARATAAWRCRRSRPRTTARRPTGLLLEHLARTGLSLSALVASLPAVAMRKLALPVAPRLLFSALQEFREAVGEVEGATGGPDGRGEDRVARRLGARAGLEHAVARCASSRRRTTRRGRRSSSTGRASA
ncbi:MAG: hypothetical protein M0C28_36945 [Candidatus Moduliflexus flocculans]|nr:hypothetical protein [Candidatus Moduliflexus flocculans]